MEIEIFLLELRIIVVVNLSSEFRILSESSVWNSKSYPDLGLKDSYIKIPGVWCDPNHERSASLISLSEMWSVTSEIALIYGLPNATLLVISERKVINKLSKNSEKLRIPNRSAT